MDKINTFFLLAISIVIILGVLFVVVAGSGKQSTQFDSVINQKDFVVKGAVGRDQLLIPCYTDCKAILSQCQDNFVAELQIIGGKAIYSYYCKTYAG